MGYFVNIIKSYRFDGSKKNQSNTAGGVDGSIRTGSDTRSNPGPSHDTADIGNVDIYAAYSADKCRSGGKSGSSLFQAGGQR
jgi:hypothetical protein